MNIIFWNTYKNENIDIYLKGLIIEKDCDILVLAEYNGNIENLVNELYMEGLDFKIAKSFAGEKILIIYKCDFEKFELINDQNDYVSYGVERNDIKFNLFGVHLPSKLSYESRDIEQAARFLRKDIDDIGNALIVGDFNSNPFEPVMIAHDCLDSLPTTKLKTRTVRGVRSNVLYNPMWNFFGDFEEFPGTYYYQKNVSLNYYWNIFDQVIMTKELIDLFDKKSIEIIKKIENKNLIRRNIIDKSISDHLPLFFSLRGGLN